MAAISDLINEQTGRKISSKTALVWYNEFLESGGLEEGLRGVWDRDRWLWLQIAVCKLSKESKKIAFDVATRDLESLIAEDPPKFEVVLKAF